jgi:hypothetical protein
VSGILAGCAWLARSASPEAGAGAVPEGVAAGAE